MNEKEEPVSYSTGYYVTKFKKERKLSNFFLNHLYRIEEFKLFNEGVTDLIAEEITDEYRARVGERKPVVRSFSYPAERMFVNEIIDSLSRELDLSDDVIREGLIASYFRGDSFEIFAKELLDLTGVDLDNLDSLDKDAIDTIKALSNEQKIRLITNYGRRSLFRPQISFDHLEEIK